MTEVFSKIRKFNLTPYLLIFYSVGIAGLLIPQTRDLFQALVPFNLLLNIILLVIYHGKSDNGFLWKALVIVIAGIVVEIVGVNTGLIFGSYEYGTTLGPKVLHTPLMIGVNWLMLVYCSLVITSRFIESTYFRAIIGAAMLVVYDFALEPAAISLGMWNWGGPVPLQNYIAWLLVSFVMIWFADRFRMVNTENKIAAPLFFIQLAFFIVLDISLMIW